jgi:hypothetical protein
MKKSQAWSVDVMLAVIIFISAIFLFYSLLDTKQNTKADELKDDAELVMDRMNVTEDVVQVDQILDEEYPDLKAKVKVENEFCVYLEDEEGNLIKLNEDKVGVGSDTITIDGTQCS